jgi:hypothetical protein
MVPDQGYHFWILFKFSFKDEIQYYGLRKMSLCNV